MFGSETVQVKVSKTLQIFHLHKGVLSFYSKYFDAALNGRFKEAKLLVLELATESVSTFEHSVTWLYARQLPTSGPLRNRYQTLCELWAFADRREVPMLMNATVNGIRDETARTWQVPDTTLHFVYEATVPTAHLKRLIVMLLSRHGGSSMLRADLHERWPEEAVWEMLCAVTKLKEETNMALSKEGLKVMDMCEYHSHEDSVKCAKFGERAEAMKSFDGAR